MYELNVLTFSFLKFYSFTIIVLTNSLICDDLPIWYEIMLNKKGAETASSLLWYFLVFLLDHQASQILESKFKMDLSRHLHMHGCIKRQVYFKILSHKVEIKGCGFGGLRSTGVEIVQVDNLMSRWHDGDIITHSRFSDKRLKNCRYCDMFR